MEEERRESIKWLVFAVSMVVVVVIMFINFYSRGKLLGEEYYESQMTDIANAHADSIYTELKNVEAVGATAARLLSYKENPDKNDIRNVASTILNLTEAGYVIYHGDEESGIKWDGKELKTLDLTGFTYFRMIYRATDVKYSYIKNDGNGEAYVLIIIPVGTNADKNLLVFYPMSNIDKMLRVKTEFDANAFGVLVNIDGTVITDGTYDSNYLKNGNLWNGIKEISSTGIEKIQGQISSYMAGCFETVSKEGEEYKTLVYAPVKINQWAVIIGVDQDFVYKKELNYWKESRKMLYQLLGVLTFFFAVFLIFNYISKKKDAERDKQLREKANTDLLTGLTNKLATERLIKEYMEQNPDSMGMMFIIDIDNFKKINDTLGHAFGDEVLRTFGRNIGSVFRVTDIIGRTGGDEFTIFLKFLKTDENTLQEAKKLVNFFANFTAGEYVKYSATASIGAAVFPAHGADFNTLYKAADKALYKAKQRGKNQLAFYDDRDRKGEEDSKS